MYRIGPFCRPGSIIKGITAGVAAVFLFLTVSSPGAVEERWESTDWWDEAWSHRIAVETAPPPPGGEITTAQIALYEDSDLCRGDGSDIRVVSSSGDVRPAKVAKDGNSGLLVTFLTSPEDRYYRIYFGNPDAPPPAKTSFESGGGVGLTLETRPLADRIYRASDIAEVLSAPVESYDKGAVAHIDHRSSPFGPDRDYLAIYKGILYAPEEGGYSFAVKARDVALFKLLKGGEEILTCRQDAAVLTEGWRTPHQPEAKRTVQLQKGWYEVRYYHIANAGPHLARLGWQTPSGEAMTTVPQEAFPTHLPVRRIAREKRGEELNPFFEAEHLYDLKFPKGNAVFHHLRLTAGDYICRDAGQLTYQWTFDDGKYMEGREIRRDWPAEEELDVTLEVSDTQGGAASITLRVHPSQGAEVKMDTDMSIRLMTDIPVLRREQTLDVELSFRNRGPLEREFSYSVVQKSAGVKIGDRHIGLMGPSEIGNEWHLFEESLTIPPQDAIFAFSLLLHGRVIMTNYVSLYQATGGLSGLHIDQPGSLSDANGHPALLVLRGLVLGDAGYRRYARSGSVRIAVLDSLNQYSPDTIKTTYLNALRERLEDTYRPLRFEFIYLDDTSTSPSERFFAVLDAASEHNPDIMMLSGQLPVTARTPQEHDFELFLSATIENVLSQTDTALLIVTPPPLPSRPHSSRVYSRISKKVGFQKGVAVADPYSRFLLHPDTGVYFGDPAAAWREGSSALMNQKAHNLIANEIFAAIRRNMNVELFDAVRRASL